MTALAGAAVAAVALVLGQAPRVPTFASRTEVVRLDVLVRGGAASAENLTADDFEVRDNGRRQTLRVSPSASWRWSVVVLLDASDSVNGAKRDAFRACARSVAAALREGDQAALVTFSDVVQLRSPMSTSREQFRQAVDDFPPGRSTALYDAVFDALALSRADSALPLVILLSDGRDTVSWLSAEDVVTAARQGDAMLYAVSTSTIGVPALAPTERPTWASVAAMPDDGFLKGITRETGGQLLHARTIEGVQAQIATVLDDIRARYIITYEPAGVPEAGWHKVEVRLKRKGARVVVRPGYFVP